MKEIQNTLIKYLSDSGWEKELYQYLHSKDFLHILEQLKAFREDNKRFTPQVQYMLRWLEICPVNSLKAVIMIDDWTGNNKEYTGVPYSKANDRLRKNEYTNEPIQSWNCIENLLSPIKAVSVKHEKQFDYNIERWSKQGVLLFPLASTYRLEGKPHYELWKDFTARIIDVINSTTKDIPVLLVEKKAYEYEMLYSSKNTMLCTAFPKCSLPSWPEDINKILVNQHKEPIKW